MRNITDIEQAVLGALMIELDSIYRVMDNLTEEMFTDQTHRSIYKKMLDFTQKGTNIDIFTLSNALREEMEVVGGVSYLAKISGLVATDLHLEDHIEILKEEFVSRELKVLGQNAINYSTNLTPDEALDKVSKNLEKVQGFKASRHSREQGEVLNTSISQIKESVAKRREGGNVGIDTGFYFLNQKTGGWKRGNVIYLPARPSVGKTSLAVFFAKTAASKGYWVNFYGLEMPSEMTSQILLSSMSDIPRENINNGNLTDEQVEILEKVSQRISNMPIIWDDEVGLDMMKLTAQTRKLKMQGKCDLVIIDYLQLMEGAKDLRTQREQQVAEISRGLKKLAKKENIPIIALMQLNREADGSVPKLSNIRESGSLEQDADIVLMPYREPTDETAYKLKIAKNRMGGVGTIPLYVNEDLTYFSDTCAKPDFSNPNFE